MKMRIGYEIVYSCTQPTPTILTLNVHSSRASFLLSPDQIKTDPPLPLSGYRDIYGNWVTRITLPQRRDRDGALDVAVKLHFRKTAATVKSGDLW